MSPPPTWINPIHTIPPNFQPLPTLFKPPHPPCWDCTQEFKKIENMHSKKQKTGPEEISAGEDWEVLSLDHQHGEVGSRLIHFPKSI